MTDSIATLAHLFSGMLCRPVVTWREARRSLPAPLSKFLLLTTGAESNEAAIKMAKLYTGNYEIVSLRPVLARHDLGRGRGDVRAGRRGYGPGAGQPHAAGAQRLPLAVPQRRRHLRLETELDYGFAVVDPQSTGSLAACLVEPILSSGGILELPEATSRGSRSVRGPGACC